MFYAPCGATLGKGLRHYSPTPITQGYAFAGLLADAMEQAQKQQRIVWASDLGSSVILAQSLHA